MVKLSFRRQATDIGTRSQVALIHRRAGFGLTPGERADAYSRGPAVEIDRLVEPEVNGVARASDPWDDATYAIRRPPPELKASAVADWLFNMIVNPRQGEEWMTWFWHGHLVSSLNKVRHPMLMINQIRMFTQMGLGDLRSLLISTTTDPAMLVYLDGGDSTGESPNENYARELMELFALGIGNYTEADVQAGARALTGWVSRPRDQYEARFLPRRHDPEPQTYLGHTDVNDVESVIDAVLDHPACGPFIARSMAGAILGSSVPTEVTDQLGREFASGGYEIRPLFRAILELAVERPDVVTPVIQGPLPWLVQALRSTGAAWEGEAAVRGLHLAGQVPLGPPSVAGWPGGTAWLASYVVTARFNLAAGVAALTPPDSPAALAADALELGELADILGRPEGFTETTSGALAGIGAGKPTEVLTIALSSPDIVIG